MYVRFDLDGAKKTQAVAEMVRSVVAQIVAEKQPLKLSELMLPEHAVKHADLPEVGCCLQCCLWQRDLLVLRSG